LYESLSHLGLNARSLVTKFQSRRRDKVASISEREKQIEREREREREREGERVSFNPVTRICEKATGDVREPSRERREGREEERGQRVKRRTSVHRELINDSFVLSTLN